MGDCGSSLNNGTANCQNVPSVAEKQFANKELITTEFSTKTETYY